MKQDKNHIAFDQYQRYQTIASVIETYRKEQPATRFHILEIGANEHKDLRLFLPEDQILFSDVALNDEMRQDPEFQEIDGTAIPYPDQHFDFVIAADVLEHVPQQLREGFLAELYRVSKRAAILCFPYQSQEIQEAEMRINAYYKAVTKTDFIWLKEHLANGLPSLDELENVLTRREIAFSTFFHGNIQTWEKLWYCHFDTVFMPDTLEYQKSIDCFYNEKLYWSDRSAPCYRAFYLLARPGFQLKPDALWETDVRETGDFLQVLLDAHKQIRLTCELEQVAVRVQPSEWTGCVYLDTGSGFSEREKVLLPLNEGHFSQVVICPEGTLRLRFDPVERKGCLLRDFQVHSSSGQLPAEPINGVSLGSYHLFQGIDPQYLVDLPPHTSWVEFQGEILPLEPNMAASFLADAQNEVSRSTERVLELSEEFQRANAIHREETEALTSQKRALETKLETYHQARNALQNRVRLLRERERLLTEEQTSLAQELRQEQERAAQLQGELEHYQLHYRAAIGQREELRNQLAEAQYAYGVISNAFFWKITKPTRCVTDGLKKILHRYKTTTLMCKGVRCLHQNGWRFTWQKVCFKWKHRKDAHKSLQMQILPEEELQGQRNTVFPQKIKFSVLTPLYNTPEQFLREMIESVQAQTYSDWELCLADGSDAEHGEVGKICDEYVQQDSRIHYRRLEKNIGVSGIWNACAEIANGEFLALLDHDDILAANALEENVKAILATQADVFYSDEDYITQTGTHINPFFKPDWSPDLLYCQMYICHLLVFRKELFFEMGGFRFELDESQDYDLMLRLSEKTTKICHIPEILYSGRESNNSTSFRSEIKPFAFAAGKKALDEHLKRKYGLDSYAEESGKTFNARFRLTMQPQVSIIIPMKDKVEMTADCIDSILTKSSYHNFEILLLDNRSEEEKTQQWLRNIPLIDKRIRVITADMEFNWSKLNNFGVSHADGDIFIFLNNDTLVISEDWIERLSENALRDDIGVVGPLLLYPDGTIQHAGVIVGMREWADHIYKEMPLKYYDTPYVSPTVSRNVLAVTGACMAVSRKTWEYVGTFDEEFIICGSDVEYGIRAYEKGLFNRYDANVQLYHLESKSRDQYTPEIDFKKSYAAYTPYRENVDPYFNINLDINSVVPKERIASMDLINFKNFLKRCPMTSRMYQKVKNVLMTPSSYIIPEVTELKARKSHIKSGAFRINLLIPTVDKNHVFGGISTAIKFFGEFQKHKNLCARIIVTDSLINEETAIIPNGYTIVTNSQDDEIPLQILSVADRVGKTIPVRENDVFVATAWWGAYIISDVIHWQSEIYNINPWPLVYFIQDYEPGFYPWSSRYLMADSTYRLDIPVFAVMNTSILKDYFKENGYSFAKTWSFEPSLNDKLKCFLPKSTETISKKKQILVYGRPSVARNAFEIIVYALKEWCMKQADIGDWTILSAGESHADIDLGNGAILHSLGKLSLDRYARVLLQTYAGVSLMVSPHPSYPPLEMAAFGVKTITNFYANKDLASFSPNITSLLSCNPTSISNELIRICADYNGFSNLESTSEYIQNNTYFEQICQEVVHTLLDKSLE